MKTGKTSKIDRITNILEGRKDSKFEHNGHAGGLTNKEKLRKNKDFNWVYCYHKKYFFSLLSSLLLSFKIII